MAANAKLVSWFKDIRNEDLTKMDIRTNSSCDGFKTQNKTNRNWALNHRLRRNENNSEKKKIAMKRNRWPMRILGEKTSSNVMFTSEGVREDLLRWKMDDNWYEVMYITNM